MENIDQLLKEKDKFLSSKRANRTTTWTPNDILVYIGRAEVIIRNNKKVVCGICIIDVEDINKIKNYKWSLSSGYARTSINGITLRMHTLLMNPPKDKQIDHINHNGLDNRKNNLRILTQKENMKNCSRTQESRIFNVGINVKKQPKRLQ